MSKKEKFIRERQADFPNIEHLRNGLTKVFLVNGGI